MSDAISCFKAYDARGKVPDELNADIAYRVGRAYAEFVKPRRVALGRDVRLTSEELFDAVSEGLLDGGADVLDLGLCGTEQVYFAAFHLDLDGGIMITASHNPIDYNGFKFVRAGAQPLSSDNGLIEIRRIAEQRAWGQAGRRGTMTALDLTDDYIDHLLGYIGDVDALQPLVIATNPGNGMAGPVIDRLAERLPFDFRRIQHEPDGRFPNGIPNPLLPECRADSIAAVHEHHADMAVAWDGDFDRCFLFDHSGRFIEGYYIVGLLAAQTLINDPGAWIVYDPRLVWNTLELIEENGGKARQSRVGHPFMKAAMREVNGAYGGEMSAHHYFRDFAYCDSGMIPWLLIAESISSQGKSLATLVDERIARFPCSGEINSEVGDPPSVLERLQQHYAEQSPAIDTLDGVAMDFGDWRVNIRPSNTEPLLRLNVETRGDFALMEEKRDEVLALIRRFGG